MFTLWFMGRPAAGKSTVAAQVENELVDMGYPIENLDGDEVRQNLHPDLGFTREERAINNRRTAFISNLLNRNGIPTIVAMITPFRDAQQRAREIIEEDSTFVLIYVNAPLEICEERDPKGLYQRAREGNLENFTGVNHPFQEPINPDVAVDTVTDDVETSAQKVLTHLRENDILEDNLDGAYEFSITRSQEREILNRLRDGDYID